MTVAFVTGGAGWVGTRLVRALRARGDAVYALASSDGQAARIERAGAEPVRGSIDDPAVLRDGMRDAEVVFHLEEKPDAWGRPAEFERINVEGTNNVLWAMARAGVGRIVHLSTAWVLADGRPVVDADEHTPAPERALGWYPRTKLDAERAVLAAAAEGLEPVVVRPGFVWGPGDTVWLPRLVDSIGTGRFVWTGSGRHLVSTTHVANLVHGLVVAGDRGRPGGVYFVTDGPPVVFRELVERYLATAEVKTPTRSRTPAGAKVMASWSEAVWNLMNVKRPPALTRTVHVVTGVQCTVRDDRARTELGYEPVVDLDTGMRQLARSRRRNVSRP